MFPLLRTRAPFCAERTLTEQSRNASLRINLFVSAIGDYYPSERHTVRVANPGVQPKGASSVLRLLLMDNLACA